MEVEEIPLDEHGEFGRQKAESEEEEDGEGLGVRALREQIYEAIDPVVPRTDDPALPVLTFRVWVLGLVFGSILSISNSAFTYRTNDFAISPLVPLITAYPLGLLMARVLPSGPLNPGPFNVKEHAAIFMFCSVMAQVPYGIYTVICQRFLLYQDRDLPFWWCICFVLFTQCIGFGVAGLLRCILVRPAVMLWYETLGPMAMLNSLHRKEDSLNEVYPMTRSRFFLIVTVLMATYQLIPGFFAPMLGAVSVICWFVRNRNVDSILYRTQMALGSSQTFGGVGILSFSFDWSIINAYSPIITPLWATLNMFTGMIILLWIAVPLLWATNSFGSDTILGTQAEDGPNGTSVFPLGFALNAAFLFDKTGSRIKPRLFIQRNPLDERDVILNETMYQSSQPIQVTAFTVVGYFSSFMVLSSAFVHCLLWYGKDSLQRLRANYDTKDVHLDLMEKYPKIPQCWYILILSVSSIACLILCEIEPGFKLEWWGTITAVLLGSIVAVPFGVIQAISGQNISQHNVSELIWGFVRPGKITSVLTFKSITYATQSTAMNLLSSYKFGVYAKIPPRVIFKVHLVATVCGAIQATGMAMIMYMVCGSHPIGKSVNSLLPSWVENRSWRWNIENPKWASQGWSNYQYSRFLSDGLLMGAIGPSRFFADNPRYICMVYGFLAGLIGPVIPWLLYRRYPYGYWHLINIPIIAAIPIQANSMRSDMITPLLVAVIVNFYIKKYKPFWWKKYAYVMSAGFDTGASVTLLVLFLVLVLVRAIANQTLLMPYWLLHRVDTEGCAPQFYLDCQEKAKWNSSLFGGGYNKSADPQCVNFQTSVTNWYF